MKRNLSKGYILLVITMLLLLVAGCGPAGEKKAIVDDNANTEDDSDNTSDKQEDGQTADNTTASTDLETIDEMLLFDKEGVRVTAKELVDDPIWGKGINVLIENESDKNVTVQCNTVVVNNYMMSDIFSSSVAAGKKDNETITLMSSGLEAAGIDTIAEVNIRFSVVDEDYETLFDTDEITLKTSAYGTVTQPAVDEGKELLNQAGVRIVGNYVEEDSIWGAGVQLFIENTSEKDVIVQCDDMSINGFMVTPYFSCQVNKGRLALEAITIMNSDLEENDITEIKDLELTLLIVDAESYDTIYESDPIPFTVE